MIIQSDHVDDDNEDSKIKTEILYPGFGRRHLQSFLLSLCLFGGYLQRVNLSVTIVAIAKENDVVSEYPTYSWSLDVESYVLSAFFLGYLVMNFPAALLGVHFNNKYILVSTFLINGVITCFTPALINCNYEGDNETIQNIFNFLGPGNWKALVFVRGLQGVIQAFMIPTVNAIIARWAPPNERGLLGGFIMGGIPFGTMISFIASGILSGSSLGWPSVFYVSGAVGILWALLFWKFGSNSPNEDGNISKAEFTYICSQIEMYASKKERKPIPWKGILTSLPVWAIVVAHTGHNWAFWLLLSEMPTFIHSVLGFNIKEDGALSALPYFGMWLAQFPVMFLADYFNKRKITNLSTSRKLFNSIGMWGGALSMMVLGYMDNDRTAAVTLYVCAITAACCVNAGFNINHMDLSPNYSGILMGISNGLASTGGLGSPLIVSYLVDDVTSVTQWRNVFHVGTCISFFSNLFFIIFGSGKTQRWNK